MSLTLIPRLIASEIGATPQQVTSAVELLDGGATVPFIARYRKEVTGGLDDTQLRDNIRLAFQHYWMVNQPGLARAAVR